MISYAMKRSTELGLDLVASPTSYFCLSKYKKSIKWYDGDVRSLGSSSPMEYVNAYYRNENRVFSIGTTYEIQKLPSVREIKKMDQGYSRGATDLEKSREVFEKVLEKRPKGITFNQNKLEGKVSGGNCSALSFEFIQRYFEFLKQRESLQVEGNKGGENLLDPMQEIEKLLERFENGGGENVVHFRSIQEAFNTFEIEKTEDTVDITAAKIQAIANYFDFEASPASDERDLIVDGQGTLVETVNTLKNGVYLLRTIRPEDNERLEMYGHSMVWIKKDKETFFYDPTNGARIIQSKWPADFLFTALQYQYARAGWDGQGWKTRKYRFYEISPANSLSVAI